MWGGVCVSVRVNCIKLIWRNRWAVLADHDDQPLWFPIQDTDLVPSDIAAGLTLLHQQQDSIRNNREPEEVISPSPGSPQVSPYFCWVEQFWHKHPLVNLKTKQNWPAALSGVILELDLWLLLGVVCHLSGGATPHDLNFNWREPIPGQSANWYIFKALSLRKWALDQKFLLGGTWFSLGDVFALLDDSFLCQICMLLKEKTPRRHTYENRCFSAPIPAPGSQQLICCSGVDICLSSPAAGRKSTARFT